MGTLMSSSTENLKSNGEKEYIYA